MIAIRSKPYPLYGPVRPDKLTYNQSLTRIAASLARRAGFATIISDSASTESSYLYVGRPSKHGGLDTLATLRVSDHCEPGHCRGGWIFKKSWHYFDLRPRSRRADRERIDNFLRSILA